MFERYEVEVSNKSYIDMEDGKETWDSGIYDSLYVCPICSSPEQHFGSLRSMVNNDKEYMVQCSNCHATFHVESIVENDGYHNYIAIFISLPIDLCKVQMAVHEHNKKVKEVVQKMANGDYCVKSIMDNILALEPNYQLAVARGETPEVVDNKPNDVMKLQIALEGEKHQLECLMKERKDTLQELVDLAERKVSLPQFIVDNRVKEL